MLPALQCRGLKPRVAWLPTNLASPLKLAGVHAYIDLPIFYHSATVVFGPPGLPPSGYLLSEILKLQRVRAFYVPHSIIEQWAAEPVVNEQAQGLDFVLFGGGPLSPAIGDRLSRTTNVCQMYGSLEIGQVQLLVPQLGEWSYMELNPFEEADMQPLDDGTFEMVLHQESKLAPHRSLWHNFPTIKSWRTGDLFVPHPSKTGLWRFSSRKDDTVVISSGFKIRPLEMETVVQGHALLSGALIVGQGKPEPLLIVEPKRGAFDGNTTLFVDRIWPVVEEANKIAPSYAKIKRFNVLVTSPDRPFLRAPKGSVVRKLTIQAYADDIEAAYADQDKSSSLPGCGGGIQGHLLPALKQLVRSHVLQHLPCVSFSDTENLFARGLDSLGCARLSKDLQKEVATSRRPDQSGAISMRTIYKHPSIEELASVMLKMLLGRDVPEDHLGSDMAAMRCAVKELTHNLPPENTGVVGSSVSEKINVVLLGPRGSLEPSIIMELMANPKVAKIYCLHRGQDGLERMRAIFKEQNLPVSADDHRLCFVPFNLGKPKLGVSDADHAQLLGSANVIIHNAWKVDFDWTIDQYRPEYLPSVRELIDFSSLSPLRPRIVFVSSTSVQEWNSVLPPPVTEKPVDFYEVASPLGYGHSKHVSERVLTEASAVSGTPVTILRVGQVAGSRTSSGGKWSAEEWIPSLAAICRGLGLVPDDLPPIDWVPLDLAAKVICELALPRAGQGGVYGQVGDETATKEHLKVFNVVNPSLTP